VEPPEGAHSRYQMSTAAVGREGVKFRAATELKRVCSEKPEFASHLTLGGAWEWAVRSPNTGIDR
jgi:hypothetical protein